MLTNRFFNCRIIHKQQISSLNKKKKWCLAFPEPDQAIIVRSIHHAKTVDNLPYNFKARNYIVFGNLITAICVLFTMIILSIMAMYEPLRNLFIRVSVKVLYLNTIFEYVIIINP